MAPSPEVKPTSPYLHAGSLTRIPDTRSAAMINPESLSVDQGSVEGRDRSQASQGCEVDG